MSRKWRVALVGTGNAGAMHLRALSDLRDRATVVSVADHTTERARAVLAQCGHEAARAFASLDELIERSDFDVLHICTPSGCHMEPAMQAMSAGKNVICEKPLEVSLDRIDRMIAAAQRHGVRLAGVYQYRWNPVYRAVHRVSQECRFGRIAWAGCFTPWHRDDQYYREGNWRGTKKLDGGGAIMNQSIHAIDLLQWIAGPVRHVSAYAGRRAHDDIEVEDTLSASLQFESGAFGTIMGSTAIYGGAPVRLEIGGEHGHVVVEEGLKAFKFKQGQAEADEIASKLVWPRGTVGSAGPLLESCQCQIDCIRAIFDAWESGQPAETSGQEMRKSVAIALAMYESAARGGMPVRVR